MRLRRKYEILFFVCLLFFLQQKGKAQQETTTNQLLAYTPLNYSQKLPETLLSERSVVFITTPVQSRKNASLEFIQKAHEAFKNAGIDPVAYYFSMDVTASSQVRSLIASEMGKRKINNLIFLEQRGENTVQDKFSLVFTSFNGTPDFITAGQDAWEASSDDLEAILLKLYRNTGNSGLEKENLLIVDEPDFFYDVNIIRGKRFETFNSDLKLDKIAVPKFLAKELHPNGTESQSSQRVAESLEAYNNKVEEKNNELQMILAGYPYKYELVEYTPEVENQLWNAGFQYVLLKLNAPAKTIKRFLDYDFDETETDFVTVKKLEDGSTVLKTIPVNQMVYKYYVKHLYTGDIFLGSLWDADNTWQEALNNHIMGFKSELNIK